MKRLLYCILLLLITQAAVMAQSSNTVQLPSAYVKSGPGESFVSIGAVFAGETVTPLNRSEDATWVLIAYDRLTGWVPRGSVLWVDNIDALPVLAPNITPTPNASVAPVRITPTESALAGTVLLNNAEVAFVRSGPGRGYGRLGQLTPGMLVEPVSRNTDGTWVLIRFKDVTTLFDGFGWVARNLVQWQDNTLVDALPVLEDANLTPTLTSVPSNTPEGFVAATEIPTEVTLEAPTATTEPPTATLTLTLTDEPTFTPEPPTATDIPPVTDEPTQFLVLSDTPAITDVPPTATSTETPTETPVSVVVVVTDIPTEPALVTPTTIPATPIVLSPTMAVPATDTPLTTVAGDEPAAGFPVGLVVAGVAGLGGLLYLGMFAQGMAAARRYEDGFVVDTCPVCHRGTLTVEARPQRVLGIPSVKRTIRCNACRSVLREKGQQRWLYAVDRIENPTLYEQYNGREITDTDLKKLP